MKAIKLECFTRGAKPGDILPVGGKDEISIEEAKVLVGEKMAVEYISPVVAQSDNLPTDVKVLRAEVKALKAEVDRLTTERDNALTELKAEVDRLTTERDNALTELALAKGASNGTDNTPSK